MGSPNTVNRSCSLPEFIILIYFSTAPPLMNKAAVNCYISPIDLAVVLIYNAYQHDQLQAAGLIYTLAISANDTFPAQLNQTEVPILRTTDYMVTPAGM